MWLLDLSRGAPLAPSPSRSAIVTLSTGPASMRLGRARGPCGGARCGSVLCGVAELLICSLSNGAGVAPTICSRTEGLQMCMCIVSLLDCNFALQFASSVQQKLYKYNLFCNLLYCERIFVGGAAAYLGNLVYTPNIDLIFACMRSGYFRMSILTAVTRGCCFVCIFANNIWLL